MDQQQFESPEHWVARMRTYGVDLDSMVVGANIAREAILEGNQALAYPLEEVLGDIDAKLEYVAELLKRGET